MITEDYAATAANMLARTVAALAKHTLTLVGTLVPREINTSTVGTTAQKCDCCEAGERKMAV